MEMKDVPTWLWVLGGGVVAGTVLAFTQDAYAAPNLGPLRVPGTTGSRTPRGPEYEPQHLPVAWPNTAAGHCAFVAYMRGLLAKEGLVGEQATLFIAHVARETGFGRAVWNNNFGNIKQYDNTTPWHRLSDGQPYKSYASARAGVHDNIAFLRDRNGGRYLEAWRMLLRGDVNWYGRMGLSGYYECTGADGNRHTCRADEIHVPQAQYEGTLAYVRRCG